MNEVHLYYIHQTMYMPHTGHWIAWIHLRCSPLFTLHQGHQVLKINFSANLDDRRLAQYVLLGQNHVRLFFHVHKAHMDATHPLVLNRSLGHGPTTPSSSHLSSVILKSSVRRLAKLRSKRFWCFSSRLYPEYPTWNEKHNSL